MTIQRHFKLALTAGHTIPLVINANQYDSGEQWLFTLYNDGVRYTPSSGAIVGIKADRLGIINTGTVDANGRVVINETRQMTAAVGKNIFELLIDDQTHGTANFMVLVEPRPGDNADLSESDYSLFEEAINGTSQAAIMAGVQEWMDENLTDPTDPIVDASLSLSGAAADAQKTGQEISDLRSAIALLSGVPTAVKNALDTLFQNVAFKNDDDVYTDEIAAVHNWATEAKLVSISAVYTQGSKTVAPTTSLESLKSDLVVTARYDNGTTETISSTAYGLSGTLEEGTSTITVTYEGKTTTFTVEVSSSFLYVLRSPFASTGTDVIDTNVLLEASKTYTFMCDHTRTGTSSKVSYIFGNKVKDSNIYVALQNQSNYLWGMGISYNNGVSLSALNKRFRTVAVAQFNADGTATIDMYYKNITDSGAVRTFQNTYSDMSENAKTVCLGDAAGDGTGALAVIHDFKIYSGAMSSTDITDYLTNGAS